VEPTDPADIARGLERVATDPGLRASLRERGFRRSSAFTWERCIRSTVELYARLLGVPGHAVP